MPSRAIASMNRGVLDDLGQKSDLGEKKVRRSPGLRFRCLVENDVGDAISQRRARDIGQLVAGEKHLPSGARVLFVMSERVCRQ
jgi:hypothetical protein